MNVGGIIALSVMIPIVVIVLIVIVALALLRWHTIHIAHNFDNYDRKYKEKAKAVHATLMASDPAYVILYTAANEAKRTHGEHSTIYGEADDEFQRRTAMRTAEMKRAYNKGSLPLYWGTLLKNRPQRKSRRKSRRHR